MDLSSRRPTADPAAVARAVTFAAAAHGNQLRKAPAVEADIAYLAHLLTVAGTVLEYGGSTDTAVAAVLHDVVEDTDTSLGDLEAMFGGRVAQLVDACTDTLPGDTPERKSPWLDRKRAYFAHLAEADADVCLIAVADKLSNLSSLFDALSVRGKAAFDSFNASPEQTLWFHSEVLIVAAGRIPAPLEARYSAAVVRLHSFVP